MNHPELTSAIGHTFEPQHTARLMPPLPVHPEVAEFIEGLACRADHTQRHPTDEQGWPARQAVEVEVATGKGPVRVRIMRGKLLEHVPLSEIGRYLNSGLPVPDELGGWKADAGMFSAALELLRPFVVGTVGGDRLESEQLPMWIIPQLRAAQRSNLALETLRVFVGGPGLLEAASADLADLAIQQLTELRADVQQRNKDALHATRDRARNEDRLIALEKERLEVVGHFMTGHLPVGELPAHVAKLEAEAEDAVLFMRHIAVALDLDYSASATDLVTAATSAMRRARGLNAHLGILAEAIRTSKPPPASIRAALFEVVTSPIVRWLRANA